MERDDWLAFASSALITLMLGLGSKALAGWVSQRFPQIPEWLNDYPEEADPLPKFGDFDNWEK